MVLWRENRDENPWMHSWLESTLSQLSVPWLWLANKGLSTVPRGGMWHHWLCCSIRAAKWGVSKSFGHGTVGYWPALGQCHSAYRSYTSAARGRYAGIESELRMHSCHWGICAVLSHWLWLQHTQAMWVSCMAVLNKSINYIMRSSRDTQRNPEWNSVRS